jgi:S-DNA-T family DNA segregation ATPase FtsK/SpoIIIE
MRSSSKSAKRSPKSVSKKSVKQTNLRKTIDCPECGGMGKKLIRKNGVIKLVRCTNCVGGQIQPKEHVMKKIAEKTTKKSKTHRSGKASKIAKQLAEDLDDDDEEDEEDDDDDEFSGLGRAVSQPTMSAADVKKLTREQRLAKETIEERAAFFGCPGKVTAVRHGPIITLYEFSPSKTTRIKRLINLQEDLALALSADAVMVRRIPGKEVVGIEISNEAGDRKNVGFRASLASVKAAKKRGMSLPMNLGTDPFGEPIVDDLATMPHLLIAGSTGSGKSVSLNCIISSLLAVCSPDELQFYMIDPKGVELTHYNDIPHMLEPMVTSPHYAKQILANLIQEMRKRLQTLTYSGVRDIKGLNELYKAQGKPPMPRIVLIVDELGDLMLQDRRGFTAMFAEIAQIARATGIHMIAATQRPSVDVLSGKIKVNFPGRMAFKVTSMADSKTIIQRKGAEGLLGCGDMLYLSPSRSSVIRIHAPWVPLADVVEIATQIRQADAKRREEAARIATEARLREVRETMPRVKIESEESKPINLDWLSK